VEVHRQLAANRQEPSPELRQLTEAAIVASDNEAANRLLDKVGITSVNRTMAGLGLRSTVLHNKFSAEGKVAETRFNQTTPDDMLTLLEPLATERLVNAEASRAMLRLMERTKDNSKLRRYLPREVRVAHKSGWFEGVSNDVGVVYASRGPYLIAVMAEGPFDYEIGNQLLSAVSRAVYEAWELRQAG
jgi:beta-lactamase class A